jgi:hypothetical protein
LDPDTIRKIALEVVRLLPGYGWTWTQLLLQVLVTGLAAALAAWGSAYLKTRAQNLATKQDFDELQRQLAANRQVVETIKAEVGQRDWAQREWTNLRRTKVALLNKAHECRAYLESIPRKP